MDLISETHRADNGEEVKADGTEKDEDDGLWEREEVGGMTDRQRDEEYRERQGKKKVRGAKKGGSGRMRGATGAERGA